MISLWATLAAFWLIMYAAAIHTLWEDILNIFVLLNASAYIMLIGNNSFHFNSKKKKKKTIFNKK